MNGGTGDDTLTGGKGPDRFVFNANFGDDVITDFAKSDLIQFVGVPGVLSIADLTFTQSGGGYDHQYK
jgi:serralysin